MKRSLCLALVSAWVTTASAQAPKVTPAPADFAMQLPLTVSGNNGVVQLTLPKAVYLTAQTPGLDDLRIYNGAGELLPFAWIEPGPRAREPTQIQFRESPTVLFPVNALPGDAARDLTLEVKSAADGSLLAISAKTAGGRTGTSLSALIVDLGKSAPIETLEGLQLALPESQSDYRATLAIDRSEDLKLWDTVAQTNVDWLSGSGDERLVNDRIEIPRSEGRYLRIRWIAGEPLAFARVLARWRSRAASVERAIEDLGYEVTLVAASGRVPYDHVYTTSPAIAATEIGVNLPEANTVLRVALGFYRASPAIKPGWYFEPEVVNTFYRLTQDGRERTSSRLSVAPMSGNEWVLRIDPESPVQKLGPELVLRWKPRTLAFTARGSGFRLAYGANPALARNYSGGAAALESVAPGFRQDEINALEAAAPGEPVATTRAVAQPVTAPPARIDTRDQRKWLLWGVLILGVLVLAYMSWRLFRQLG
jgi:hypothetical protein